MAKNSASGCRTEIRTVLPSGKETRHYLAIYASPLLNIHNALFFAYKYKVCIPKLYDSYVSYRDLYYIYDSVIHSMPIYMYVLFLTKMLSNPCQTFVHS